MLIPTLFPEAGIDKSDCKAIIAGADRCSGFSLMTDRTGEENDSRLPEGSQRECFCVYLYNERNKIKILLRSEQGYVIIPTV